MFSMVFRYVLGNVLEGVRGIPEVLQGVPEPFQGPSRVVQSTSGSFRSVLRVGVPEAF